MNDTNSFFIYTSVCWFMIKIRLQCFFYKFALKTDQFYSGYWTSPSSVQYVIIQNLICTAMYKGESRLLISRLRTITLCVRNTRIIWFRTVFSDLFQTVNQTEVLVYSKVYFRVFLSIVREWNTFCHLKILVLITVLENLYYIC